MGPACLAFGMAAFAKISLLDPEIAIPTLMLAGSLLVGAVVLAVIQRWRKRQENETFTTHDQLTSFRLLYERGELSAEEFERVRRQLLERLKGNLSEPAAPPTPAPPSTHVTESPTGPPLPPPNTNVTSDRPLTD